MRKIILLLIIIGLAVYFNTLNHSFVWDDHFTIEENDLITHVKYIPKIFITDLFHSHAEKTAADRSNYYRPIQTLSFLIDYHIWRLHPFGFHLSSILLHMVNGILVFIAVFFVCKSRIVSLFTSILFLIHPVQTGAVAYLTGRSDILVCFFILISIIFYVAHRSITPLDSSGPYSVKSNINSLPNFVANRKKSFYPISVLAFILALLSKEVAVIFPLILVLYDVTYWKFKDSYTKENRPFSYIKRYFAYLFVDILYVTLRLSVFNFTPEKKIFQGVGDISKQLLTMCHSLMEYIWLLIFPTNLHMEREVPLAASPFEGSVFLSLLGIALLIFLAITACKRSRTIFFGIAWFITFLIPFSNIIPVNAMMAEHWLYVPSVGFFLVVSILFLKLRSIKINYNIATAFFVLLALFYSYTTIVRNRDWKDDFSIYSATLKLSPRKWKMYYNIGKLYTDKGLLEEAARFYKLAIVSGMEKEEVYTNLAIVYMDLGRLEESEENFNIALSINPNEPLAHNGLGRLFEMRGLLDEAIAEYEKALKLFPNFYDAHVNLGAVCDKLGKFDEAIFHFEKALDIQKDPISYYNLGNAYYRAGDVEKAIEVLEEARAKFKN